MNQQTQLAIEAGPDDVIDSDEERNLLQEIKEEVQNRIRHELKDELNVFSDKYDQLTRLEQTAGQLADDDESRKIREGLAKIRKLDLILSKKVRREKEVKRDRILLERRLHKDLDELRAEGKISSHELLVNTDKFLALTLPESHNEGVIVDEPIPASPVFRTEVHETDDRKQSRPINEANRSTGPANSTRDNTVSPLSSADSIEELNLDSASGSATSSARRRTHSNKDFIKRNVQLAADADSSVPMTDDEKNRIKNLLQDLDTVPELPIDGTESVVSLEGEGFMLESDQQSHMSQIDNRLKALLPVDKFESICSTPVSCHSSHSIGQVPLSTSPAQLSQGIANMSINTGVPTIPMIPQSGVPLGAPGSFPLAGLPGHVMTTGMPNSIPAPLTGLPPPVSLPNMPGLALPPLTNPMSLPGLPPFTAIGSMTQPGIGLPTGMMMPPLPGLPAGLPDPAPLPDFSALQNSIYTTQQSPLVPNSVPAMPNSVPAMPAGLISSSSVPVTASDPSTYTVPVTSSVPDTTTISVDTNQATAQVAS